MRESDKVRMKTHMLSPVFPRAFFFLREEPEKGTKV